VGVEKEWRKKKMQAPGFDLQNSNFSKGMNTNGYHLGLTAYMILNGSLFYRTKKLKIWGP
jgi:hypothetical protein